MEYKVSAFKVIINGVKAFDIYLADWDWLCEQFRIIYNLSSELKMLISNRWSWPSLFAFNIFSVRPANSGLFYL